MALAKRIVITGIGLTAPNANDLTSFRHALLNDVSGIQEFETRHMGKVLAGVCNFEETRYQDRKAQRRGTRRNGRAGSGAVRPRADARPDGQPQRPQR